MIYYRLLLFGIFFLTSGMQPSYGQFFLTCEDGSIDELKSSIWAHNEHIDRLNKKFDDIWYFQGELPETARTKVSLDDIQSFLKMFRQRKAAALFYANSRDRLCAWLISGDAEPVSNASSLDFRELQSLQPQLIHSLGVRALQSNRRPAPRQVRPADPLPQFLLSWEEAVKKMSSLLLPDPIAQAILDRQIDTLVVVPVTVSVKHKDDRTRTVSLVSAVGTVPFPLLKVGEKTLVDIASVVIAPGFAAFKESPRQHDRSLPDPVIVGDPVNSTDPDWVFSDLPQARLEAAEVAKRLQAEPLIGDRATRNAVLSMLEDKSAISRLIHFATHGVADDENPLDGSFLLLSDGRLTAREISRFRFAKKPLVVMSACETGLGKDFGVGTIGLARAWLWAGASNIVMSLWNVDDAATRELMTTFIKLSVKEPADKALQKAMRSARAKNHNPAYWASFIVFGAPEIE